MHAFLEMSAFMEGVLSPHMSRLSATLVETKNILDLVQQNSTGILHKDWYAKDGESFNAYLDCFLPGLITAL